MGQGKYNIEATSSLYKHYHTENVKLSKSYFHNGPFFIVLTFEFDKVKKNSFYYFVKLMLVSVFLLLFFL